MSRKESCVFTMTVTMDLDKKPIPLFSSLWCFFVSMNNIRNTYPHHASHTCCGHRCGLTGGWEYAHCSNLKVVALALQAQTNLLTHIYPSLIFRTQPAFCHPQCVELWCKDVNFSLFGTTCRAALALQTLKETHARPLIFNVENHPSSSWQTKLEQLAETCMPETCMLETHKPEIKPATFINVPKCDCHIHKYKHIARTDF